MFLHIYRVLYTLLRSGWESIRKDRFSLTPQALYDELARNAQFILSAWSGDATRRQARMRAPLEHEEGEDAAEGADDDAHEDEVEEEAPMRPRDEFLDIDKEFRCGIRYQRFANWEDTASYCRHYRIYPTLYLSSTMVRLLCFPKNTRNADT